MLNPDIFSMQALSGLVPERMAELQKQFMQSWQELVQQAGTGSLQAPADRRFSSAAWQASPQALFTAHAYLLTSNALQQMVQQADLSPEVRERLRFAIMQWIEAAAPSNYFATNPDAQQKLLDSGGDSLQRGLANLMQDMQRGRISQTDESAFAPGRNLAMTAGTVVFQNELFQLLQYQPQTAQVHDLPLLMVPPCINKYYILDLQPANSLVQHIVQAGFETYMISWRNPRFDDSDASDTKTWDDYIEDGVLQAIKVVQAISRRKQINALGFCVGGTMLASALAVARARGQKPVAALTLLTTFLDFASTGIMDVFVDEVHASMREQQLGDGGLMTAAELATTFSFLRPAELVWNYVESNYLKGESPRAFDLLSWNADGTNLSGPFFAWYFRKMYLENQLKSDQLKVCGATVQLDKLDMPAYVYGSRDDHIVPWQAAYASARLLAGPVRFVLGESGHIAGVVNPPAKNKRGYWRATDDSSLPPEPQQWLAAAEHLRGSWWPDWLQWLAEHSGAWRNARKNMGNKAYPGIEAAPGSYVKVKAL